jgi:hypothetical protein
MNQESPSKPIHLSEVDGAADRLVADLDRTARWGLWALPAWALLLLLGTLTHQPDPRTEFESFARYVTTTEFLVSHLVASIIGAAVGVLGLLALYIVLALRTRSTLARAGLVLAVLGNVMVTAIFGMAAFGQPAVGRLYLAGEQTTAVTIYGDMYGVPLTATAAAGLLLLVVGVVLLGFVIARSRVPSRWTGIGMAVGIVVFGVIGVILADVVQTIGAVVLLASALGLANSGRRVVDIE